MAAAATTAATHRHVGSAFFMIISPSPSIFGVRCRGHFIATAMAAGNRANSDPTSAAGHLIARLVRAKPPAGGGARTWEFLCAVLLVCFVLPCEEYKQVEVSLATVVVRETAVSNPSAPPASNVRRSAGSRSAERELAPEPIQRRSCSSAGGLPRLRRGEYVVRQAYKR